MKTRKEAEALILAKAETDAAFRKQLVDDPKGVVARELGIDLPPEFKIKVLQESDKNIYIVLPPPVPIKGELADTDLEQVAGGQVSDANKGRNVTVQKVNVELGAGIIANKV